MIDFKKELENYPPVDLNKLLESNTNISDNIRNSIVLYNKALENFKTKSEDIAIIELRKAISLNPDFHEAINLLGVFYIYAGDYGKASESFQKVINAERNSIKALEYLRSIDPGFQPLVEKQGRAKQKTSKEIKKVTENKKNERDSSPSLKRLFMVGKYKGEDVAKIAIGFIAGSLLVFLLSLGFYSNDAAIDAASDIDAQPKPTIDAKDDFEVKYNELSEQYQNLSKQLVEVNKEVDYYLNVSKLLEIEKLVSMKSYQAAAEKLLPLKNISFKEIEKEKYNKLVNEAMPKAAWELFEKGRELLRNKTYQEALDRFNRAQSYTGDDWKYSSVNLYYIGVCYKELGNSTMALEIFDELIKKYPSSKYAKYSKDRVKEIRQTP